MLVSIITFSRLPYQFTCLMTMCYFDLRILFFVSVRDFFPITVIHFWDIAIPFNSKHTHECTFYFVFQYERCLDFSMQNMDLICHSSTKSWLLLYWLQWWKSYKKKQILILCWTIKWYNLRMCCHIMKL